MQGQSLDMDMGKRVQDVQLPGPTIKIVVFKEMVFKLKYMQRWVHSVLDLLHEPGSSHSCSEHSLPEAPVTAGMQADLMVTPTVSVVSS